MAVLNENSILSWIQKYLDAEFGIENVKIESKLINDLELDSLEVFTMLGDIEDEFQITIPEQRVREMFTVADLISVVAALVGEAKANL